MADRNKFSPEMQSYFNSLPKYLQENIVQSKAGISTLSELQSVAQNMQHRMDTQF